tara:strand:- start:492 stop:1190 length:699 start_codon:yes stop_codon:yes gene_type:complete
MNRLLTGIFMLFLITFMVMLSSFIDYENYVTKTAYNVDYKMGNLYENKSLIDTIMLNKSNIELVKSNRLYEIESKLNNIQSIKEANIFRDLNFNLSIEIIERQPLAYYEKLDSYIDLSGVIVKRNKKLDDTLPKIYGNVSKNNIRLLVDVIKAFNKDDFFNRELNKMWFDKDELFLNLNSFLFDIRFGDNNKLKNKIQMLKGFCLYNIENKRDKIYKQIDLVYENQLLAIKK